MNEVGSPRAMRADGGYPRTPSGSPRLEHGGGGYQRPPGQSAPPRVERTQNPNSGGGARREAARDGGMARTNSDGGSGARERR